MKISIHSGGVGNQADDEPGGEVVVSEGSLYRPPVDADAAVHELDPESTQDMLIERLPGMLLVA
ncbi:MAG: hypothetical protein MJE77_13945 [Proteobacteria bacterium]|nr:hypothetical protein [Pseudomonadota bacterium]